MKHLMKAVALCGVLAVAAPAFATPISGSISIFGFDTFDATQITFTPNTGTVEKSTMDLTLPVGTLLNLTSFVYTGAHNITLFATQGGTSPAISFVIDYLTAETYTPPTNPSDPLNPTLGSGEVIAGIGTFSDGTLMPTVGSFSLSTNSTGITTFTINGTVPLAPTAATPEPSSLILLGTGVLGAAGMLRRRFTGRSNA